MKIRRSEERGHANHGWLDSYHTFSFANYFDPEHVQFSVLRVINQDRVEPGKGFQTHGHQDMEIISYVLDGVLEHKDSMGNGSQMRPGEVQLMSAGTGVTHSEFNAEADAPLEFLQMWVLPAENGTQPRYEQREYPEAERQNRLRLVISPDGSEGSVRIGQDARMFAGLLQPDRHIEHAMPAGRKAWFHLARGRVVLNGELLDPGDGAAFETATTLELTGRPGDHPAEFVLFDLP